MAWRTHLFAALRNPHDPRILMLRSDRAWRLPHVFLPERAGFANGRNLVAAFERRLGSRPWLLRQIRFIDDVAAERREVVHELEVLDRGWAAPAHGRWVGRGDLDRLALVDEPHRELLDHYLDALERGAVPPERPPWARPGWLGDVRTWIEREAARLGHTVREIEQVKQWSISCVLRVVTDGPDLYFKVSARLPLFVEEATVTERLAERFPEHVPAPLAVDPEQGWLLLPAFDELFDWDAPLATRCEALRRFAGLQRQTAELTAELLADGCLDRRLNTLNGQIEPLLDDPDAVARLTDDEVGELRSLVPALKQACRSLSGFAVPAGLVHGDLHMLNVARVDGNLVYFDWTDACVAHPFIDLHSLQWEKDDASRAALLDAYLGAWEGVVTPERLHEAVSLAAVVTPLHHAVSYQRIVAGLEPDAKTELDATHEFLREVLARAKERFRGKSA